MLIYVEHFLLAFLSLCSALRPVTLTPVTSIAHLLSASAHDARVFSLSFICSMSVYGVYHGAKLGPGYLAGYLRLAQAR